MSNEIQVLWTGGWDSTFRVLDAVTKGLAVQPHYLVDYGRPSHAVEFLTIGLITQEIKRRYPAAQIAWPRMIGVRDIPLDTITTEAFEHLKRIEYLGGQYDWIARYCKADGIKNLELCIHKEDRARIAIGTRASLVQNGDDPFYIVQDDGSNLSLVFKYYRLPVLEMTKLEMKSISEERGFLDLMEMTWFCHSPRYGEPCGVCNPCIYTIEEGLSERLPPAALARQRSPIRLLKRRGRTILNKLVPAR